MPISISGPKSNVTIVPERLNQESFTSFGTVIKNPAPSLIPSSKLNNDSLPANAVLANQGSAIKYLNVTDMKDFYGDAPSHVQSKAVMNMFVCAPRQLVKGGQFPVEILERHPYTTQTFIPLGLSPLHAHEARYLVIVAPSLTPSSADESLPVPLSPVNGETLPGRGLPNLKELKAFIADGSQAVTYGAGTWHAPMVVVGTKAIDFVVVQFANGIGIEDCQEASLDGNDGQLMAAVPTAGLASKL